MHHRILLIESDKKLASEIVSAIGGIGLFIEAYTDDELIIKRIKEICFDLIVCDYDLFKKTGIDVLREMRIHQPDQYIPLILLSKEANQQVFREVMQKGADDFLLKPLLIDELIDSIRLHLRKFNFWKERLEMLASFPYENPNPVTRIDHQTLHLTYSNPSFIKNFKELNLNEHDSFNKFLRENCLQAISIEKNVIDTIELHGNNYSVSFSPQLKKGYTNVYFNDVTLVKQAEEKVNQQEAFYKEILDNIPADLAVFSPDQKYLYVNHNGIKNKEIREWIIGKTDLDYIEYRKPKNTRFIERRGQAFKDVMLTSSDTIWMDEYSNVDGKDQFVLRKFHPVKNDKNEVSLVIGYGLDITERVLAENELKKSRLRYKALFESNPQMVFILNRQGTVLDVNEAAVIQLGYNFEELVGNSVLGVFPEQYHAAVNSTLKTCFEENDKEHQWELIKHKKDGTLINVYEVARTIQIDESEDYLLLVVCTDITDKKQNETLLKESSELNRKLLEQMPVPVAILHKENIIDINNAFENLFKAENHQIRFKSVIDLVSDSDKFALLQAIQRIYLQQDQDLVCEVGMKVQGKEKLKILILGNCFSNKGSDYILAVFGNITEIRSAEDNLRALAQELSKQNEDLKRFAYITSHDLRAPVINLNALLEYYDYEDPSSEINKELIVKFKQSAERISDTLNDLLEVTRIKDRTQSEIKDMCSISKIFYNCIQDNAEQIKKVEGTVTADFSQKDSIYFTKSVLNSTFTNLITNAIKYRSSERNLEITVTTETKDTNYIIRFTDNGLGMNTEKIKNRLFTLYQRFHSHVEGKGLGLYLVKSQLEALGGSLAVESEENKGTTFVISIPIQNPKKALN